MSSRPAVREDKTHNGYRTIGGHSADRPVEHEELEPKGTPHADRYRAETVHASETDEKTDKPRARKSHP